VLISLAAALLAASQVATTPVVLPAESTTVQRLLRAIPTAQERPAGYDRDLFSVWLSSGGCDTRERVLARQNLDPNGGGDCGDDFGLWYSAYDGQRTSNPSSFDVDHVVPLAEAWASGGHRWSERTRDAFANDVAYVPSLLAVTAESNRSKSDQDPAEWMPPLESYRCTYLRNWVAIKYRWQLTMDSTERSFIHSGLNGCKRAIKTPPRGSVSTAPSTQPSTPARPPSGGSSTRYQNCDAARAAGVTPIRAPSALYNANTHLDRDGDGVACE
jgi:hypothetical protein